MYVYVYVYERRENRHKIDRKKKIVYFTRNNNNQRLYKGREEGAYKATLSLLSLTKTTLLGKGGNLK